MSPTSTLQASVGEGGTIRRDGRFVPRAAPTRSDPRRGSESQRRTNWQKRAGAAASTAADATITATRIRVTQIRRTRKYPTTPRRVRLVVR
jgi:hypothetical protein